MSAPVSVVTAFAAAEGEKLWELPMPSWAYGAIALAIAMALLLLVWAFRNVAGNMIWGPQGSQVNTPRTVVHHHGPTGGTAGAPEVHEARGDRPTGGHGSHGVGH